MSAVAFQEPARFNPFPGLRPFEPDEDFLFFGRDQQTDELLRKLRTTRFLSILGTSGSGKSSLVRSGLIPSLYGGGMTSAGSRWRVAIMRPGDDPLGNLAAALAEPDALGRQGAADEGLTAAFFETTLRASNVGLIECVKQAFLGPRANVLVLVDQFEEVFRYKRSRRLNGHDEAVAFVKLLLAARTADVPCYVAMTMRSDFIGDCMEFVDLPEIVNDGVYLVPRMSRDELRLAITGPVAVGGATIAPRLVSRLLNDVGDDPDQLPILQHALMRTWNHWDADHAPREPLDLRHYEAIGTMRTALSKHAEEAYAELDEGQRFVAEKMFKALTDKGTDVRGVRRPAPLIEIATLAGVTVGDAARVVEVFRKPGRSFLMPPNDVPLHGNSIIDISHESLMRTWTRLTQWVDEEARSAQLYLGVARGAERHEQGIAALWRDPELQLALTWRTNEKPTAEWAKRYDPDFERSMRFLDESEAERDREVREREARRRRELRMARTLVVIFLTASLLMLALGAYAFSQKGKAEEAAAVAQEQKRRAEQATEQALREKQRAEEQRVRAEQEANRAQREQLNAEQQTTIALTERQRAELERQRAETERLYAVQKEQEARVQEAAAKAEKSRAEVASQRAIEEQVRAQTSERETRRLSYLAASRALALSIPQQNDQPVRSAVLALEAYDLNRENQGNAQDAELFNALRIAVDRLRPPAVVQSEHGSIRALALNADGNSGFAGTDDGTLLRVDLAAGGKPVALARFPSPVRSIALHRGRGLVAAGTTGGQIHLFDPRNASAARQINNGTAAVSSIAFSSSQLAVASLDGSVKVWNVDAPDAAPVTFRQADAKRVTSVAFSPDGKMLAAGVGGGGGALLWNVANANAPQRTACAGVDVRSLAFDPSGSTLACGGSRGEILQSSMRGNADGVPLRGHRSSVNALSYDFAGAMLTSASSDGTVRIWDAKSPGAQPIILPGHEGWVWSAAVSADGERIVSGGEDRTVRVWPSNAARLANELCEVVRRGPGKDGLTREEWSKFMPRELEYRGGLPCTVRR